MVDTVQVHRFGPNVSTDDIIAGKHKHRTMDIDLLALHAFESLDPGFARRVQPGEVIVAGSNFGCGSSREQAPLVLLRLGVGAVLAPSFARIFFRNALNVGLPLIECDAQEIGDRIRLDIDGGWVEPCPSGPRRSIGVVPPIMRRLSESAGLLGLVAREELG